MDLRSYSSIEERRKEVEKRINCSLSKISNYVSDLDVASVKNCENMVGAIQVPLGIAGPLIVSSDLIDDEVFVPLATTEGALVASVNRGCKAVSLNGGVKIISQKVGITRAPVFEVDNIQNGKKLLEYVESNFTKLKKITENSSSHLKLLEINPKAMGKNVYLRFRFDTDDAMGMNMATIATGEAADYIEKNTGAKCIALSGNMCVDKKPNYLNFIEGRGYTVSADVLLTEDVVKTVLKSKISKILNVYKRKISYGSVLSGSLGANAHIANVLGAIFLATGQDVAHIAECSVGVTTIEEADRGLYASVYLPDLVVGTVGGGTGLATQKEALSIMKLNGEDNGINGQKLAEVIGGAVLAGEISLLASLSENTLAKAHQKLGRGGSK